MKWREARAVLRLHHDVVTGASPSFRIRMKFNTLPPEFFEDDLTQPCILSSVKCVKFLANLHDLFGAGIAR
ncbi:unnamed protein product [Angiostrongylus costaricensis]|uniref:Uncharacterized protein n=1 Tax=Angiostrongylus costaricensis TaxID=334426 RepID=A0A0R3PF05_ANGCS|nr:unnamed protein product [Angiostrongylus costaricensis]